MTIKNTQTYVIYQADGAATQWDIPFPFLQKEDMEVYLLDEAGNKSLLAGDFEIDEENKIFYYPQPDSDAPPLSSDKRLLLQRRTPLCQETEFLAQQSFDPLILEQGYDKAMMIAQELANEVSRAVKFPPQSAQTQTDAAAYLQALQQAKQDAEKATAAASQSMDTASAAAQTAVEASKVAGAVLENLQHYVASAESARDTAQQAKQEVLTVQENIWQARQESQAAADLAQESAQQAMDVQEKLSSAEAEARQSALTAQTCAESAAQSAAEVQEAYEAIGSKADKDLANIPANYDYVVESYQDETQWYRLYKSGWLEQGGKSSGVGNNHAVTFLKPFADTHYTITATVTQGAYVTYVNDSKKTETQAFLYQNLPHYWHAFGKGAV
ncbi:MAG: hypothetical protein IJ311_04475 [Elusimicrobiaceae bacterium]|nr:hypothetical protein [Elusimicrobiaceae bacterium]